MSELRVKYLHQVIIVRDGSTHDGMYGLVTQIIEQSKTPLTVTFWAMETMRHENYYSVQDVELTDLPWSDYLTCDSQLRCVLDKHYTKQYYIANGKGRDPFGFDTEAEAWAHWFQDEAAAALHQLVQEVQTDERQPVEGMAQEKTPESTRSGPDVERHC